MPISSVLVALLLVLVVGVFSASPFGEQDVAYAQTPSTDSTLSNLALMYGSKNINLSPAFEKDETGYAATVSNRTSSLRIIATSNITGAQVQTYTGADADITAGGNGTGAIADGAILRSASSVPISTAGTVIGIKVTSIGNHPDNTPPAPSVSVYKITVTRLAAGLSSNAKLVATTGLSLETTTASDAITLSPGFDPDVENYTARVATGVTSVDVNATGAHDGARPVVTAESGRTVAPDTDIDNNTVDLAVSGLKVGANVITIKVTAEDLEATKTYSVRVTQAAANASDDARLSNLSLSSLTLSPAFDIARVSTMYEVNAPHRITQTIVTPTANHRGAKARVISPPDFNTSTTAHEVALGVGSTVIMIEVIAEDVGEPKIYQVTVTRAPAGASSNAKLVATSGLSLETTTASDAITLSPGFDPDVENYTARVATGVTSVDVNATGAHDGARPVVTAESGRTVAPDTDIDNNTVDLAVSGLKVGANVITIKVTAEDLVATKTYSVRVTQAAANTSDDARLSALMVGSESVNISGKGALSPGGTAAVDHMTGVANGVSSIAISANPNHSGAVVSIFSAAGNTTDAPINHTVGTPVGTDGMVDLSIGRNIVRIQVTAENGSAVRNYFVDIMRAPAGASSNAKLVATSGLSLETTTASGAITLSPGFDPDVENYTARVATGVTSVDVNATGAHDGARPVVTAESGRTVAPDTDIDNNTVDLAVSGLKVGANVITIKVTAEDLEATKTYSVRVTRASANASDDARLSALMVGSESVNISGKGALSPGGTAAVDHMTGVANGVSSIAISANPNHSGAVVSIFSAAGNTTDAPINHTVGTPVGTDGMVDLSVNRNVARIQVTAENGATVRNYFVEITRASAGASSNAKLADLMLSSVTLSPVFNGSTKMYSANVPVNITSTTVRAAAAEDDTTTSSVDEGATSVVIKSDPDDDIGNDLDTDNDHITSHSIDLSHGDNVITIVVTAADYVTMETYTVRVTRGVSDDATLSSLSLMTMPAEGTGEAIDLKDMDGMMAEFMADTMMYYATVDAGEMIEVMATASDSDATVSGDGAVSLDVGENTISVTVTAEDGTSQETYTVTVIVTAPSSDASLTSLSLMDGMGMDITLVAGVEAHWNTLDCPAMNDRVGADDQPDDMNSPYCRMYDGLDDEAKAVVDATYDEDPIEGFMSDINMYYASAANDVDMVTVSAMAMPGATVSGDVGAVSLDVGENTITVTVTAEDGTTMMTYRVMVTVLSSDATLESLTLSDITLSPPFDPATMEYTATVAYVESTTVEATPTHSGAMVDGTGEMSLAVGENVISVTVMAEDGTTEIYTVTVTVVARTLLDRYDIDDSNEIEKSEALTAVEDYLFNGTLTKEQVLDVINLYLFGE